MPPLGTGGQTRTGWAPPGMQSKHWSVVGTPQVWSNAWKTMWQNQATPYEKLAPDAQTHYNFWKDRTPPEQGFPLTPEFGGFMGRPEAMMQDPNVGPRVASFGEPTMNEGFSGRASMAEEQGMYGA